MSCGFPATAGGVHPAAWPRSLSAQEGQVGKSRCRSQCWLHAAMLPQAGPARPWLDGQPLHPWGSTPAAPSTRVAVWETPPWRGCTLGCSQEPRRVIFPPSPYISVAPWVQCPSLGVQPPHAQADACHAQPHLSIISAHHLIPIAAQPGSQGACSSGHPTKGLQAAVQPS